MTWKLNRDVLEKEKGEQANSVLEARAVFLSSLLDLQPDVATDLWTRAFGEFLYAVSDRFKNELIGEQASTVNSGGQVLAHLFFEAEHQVETSDAGNLEEAPIVCLAFGRFGQITSDQLKDAFPNWNSLVTSEKTGSLRTKINDWSVRWNLDADWCREHALDVLCEWVADQGLKWAFISPGMQLQLERRGWQRATSARIWQVQWSRVLDGLSVLNANLNPFQFRWRASTFDAPSWNYLKENQADWRLRTKLKFCAWLSEKELERIEPLVAEASSELKPSELEREMAWRYGALTKFDSALKTYLRRMRSRRKAAKSRHKLVEVDHKPKLQEHIEWAISYQVGGQSLSQIASSIRSGEGGLQASTVLRAVEDVLSLLGIPKRSDAKQGRKKGSKNRRPRILRKLGR